MRKLITSIIAVLVTMMVIGSSIALATDYVPPPGTSSAEGTVCVSLDGETGMVFDGNLTTVDAANNFVNVDFWWRGVGGAPDSPENYMFLEDSVFTNTYQPLAGTLWRFPVNTCSREQAYDAFNTHVAARQADPTVNSGFVVTWEQSQIFVPVEGDAYVAPAVDPAMDPAPATYVEPETVTTEVVAPTTETVVTTTPVVDPNMGLCPTDVTVYGDLLDSCIDDTNPVAVAGNCFVHQEYLQEGGPEVSTAGSYVSVRYTMKSGGLRWVLLPHGIYNVASRLSDDAWVTEYGVNCLFTEVLAFITADMQSQQNQGAEIATASLVDWSHSNGLFGLEDDTLPYFGGTVDPDTDTTCHAEKAKGGIMDRRSVVGKEGFFTLVEPWAPGLAPEYNSVLDPGVWNLSNNVHGSFWYYSKEFCERGQVEAQARAEANRRKKHGNVGYFENANHFGAFFSR